MALTRSRLARALLRPGDSVRRARRRLSEALLTRRRRARDAAFRTGWRRLLDSAPRSAEGGTVVALCHSGFARTAGVFALASGALAARGALPLWLLDDGPSAPPDDPRLRRCEGALRRLARTRYRRTAGGEALRHAWDVDLAAWVCRAEGIDFGPAILNAVRRDFRCYRPDLGREEVRGAAQELLASADAALDVCLELQGLAEGGRRVRVSAAELNYVPGGVFNIFCRERGRHSGLHFVDCGPAYSHFFRAGTTDDAQWSVLDITRHGADSRLDVVPEQLEAWLGQGQDVAAALGEARRVISQNRTASERRPAQADALIERVRRHRADGGIVVCAFGHLAFDLGGLRDDGPAHRDMVDWLDHSLAQLAERADVLVLVKPHIAEGRYKGNRRPLQLLRELSRAPAAPNLVWLDPLWLNAWELLPELDVGLVWRSSVALELAVAGVPALVAGHEAYYRRALPVVVPRDRGDYEARLRDLRGLRVPPGLAERAALLLKYIPERTFLQLPYFARSEGAAGPPVWDDAALARLRRRGDPELERLAAALASEAP